MSKIVLRKTWEDVENTLKYLEHKKIQNNSVLFRFICKFVRRTTFLPGKCNKTHFKNN